MVAYLLFFVLVILCLFTKKNRLFGITLLIILFTLFGWSYGNADFENYLVRWDNIAGYTDSYEILFIKFQQAVKSVGLDYRSFLIIVAAIYLTVICVVTSKFTQNWPWVLALYAIYPFAMDVVQVRNTCGLIIAYIAIALLLKEESLDLKSAIRYVVLILIASMFHAMCLVYLLVLVAVYLPKCWVNRITVVSCLVVLIAPSAIIQLLSRLTSATNIYQRFLSYIQNMNLNFENSNLRKAIIVLIMLASFRIAQYLIEHFRVYESECSEGYSDEVLNRVSKINTIMLIIVPLTLIAPDFYRACTQIALLNYIAWARAINQEQLFVRTSREMTISGYAVIVSIINLYCLILSSIIIDTVWYPLFYNNLFW